MPPHFQVIDGRANTFRMFVIEPFGLFAEKERIKSIRVFGFETDPNGLKCQNRHLCWEVVATKTVRAAHFELVAGQVPPGFIQTFPPEGEAFEPIPGRVYEVRAIMAHPLALPEGAGAKWTAK